MNLSSIHFKILRCLHQELYTISELVFILGVAEFKIRKYLKDLEYLLNCNGILEIHHFTKKYSDKINELKKTQDFLSDERKSYIILNFLYSDMLQLTKLSEELNVSRRTLSNDLSELKSYLNQFQLNIESFNFQGIQLNGKETDKRKIFELYILKNINNLDYLPIKLKDMILSIQKLAKGKYVSKVLRKVIKYIEFSCSGSGLHHIELLVCIALIRQRYSELCSEISFKNLIESNSSELKKILVNFSFLTNYERMMILDYCENRKYNRIITNEKNATSKLRDLIEIINKEFKTKIKLEPDLFIKLYGGLKCYELKKNIGYKDFYLFNKNLSDEYMVIFEKLKLILQNYFLEIDSFEIVFMNSILITEIVKDINIKIEKLENIIVVYKSLNLLTLKDACTELEIGDIISENNLIYINNFDKYAETNKITHVITFEDLDIFNNKFSNLRMLLPITQSDRLKIKDIITKI